MKILKAIFGNALIAATLVTVLAGTVLVAYADSNPGAEGQVSARAEGQVSGTALKADEGTPPGKITAGKVPRGSFIDAML